MLQTIRRINMLPNRLSAGAPVDFICFCEHIFRLKGDWGSLASCELREFAT